MVCVVPQEVECACLQSGQPTALSKHLFEDQHWVLRILQRLIHQALDEVRDGLNN